MDCSKTLPASSESVLNFLSRSSPPDHDVDLKVSGQLKRMATRQPEKCAKVVFAKDPTLSGRYFLQTSIRD